MSNNIDEQPTSIFDLNIPLQEKSFIDPTFINTNSGLFGISRRDVELFSCDEVSVLLFSFSYEGHSDLFIRIKNPLAGYDGYHWDLYYPIKEGLTSSCGTNRSYSATNPWEKFIKKTIIGTRDNFMYINKVSQHNNLFLKKITDSDVIKKELNYQYVEFPSTIRNFIRAYVTKKTNLVVAVHYGAFGKYEKKIETIDLNGNIKQYEMIKDVVYRDGGTTFCDLKDSNGVIHHYFTPSPLNKKLGHEVSPATFDGEEMVEVEDERTNIIIKQLGLIILPKDK